MSTPPSVPIRHRFLSPHLDDVALSCGGQVALLAQQGVGVHVVTVFAGDAPEGDGLSPFARSLHQAWGAGPNPFALRRQEDERALAGLGATWTHLPYLDAIYRRPGGALLYPQEQDVFGVVAREEMDAFPEALARDWHEAGKVIWHAPLAVGRHVDHQLVRTAALRLQAAGHTVRFYEDYPYSHRADALGAALEAMPSLRPHFTSYGEAILEARLAAIACYTSQIGILFGDAAQMARRTREHAAALAREAGTSEPYAEREWVPTPGTAGHKEARKAPEAGPGD